MKLANKTCINLVQRVRKDFLKKGVLWMSFNLFFKHFIGLLIGERTGSS